MSEPTSHQPTDLRPPRGPATPTPRWVKLFGVVVLVLLVIFIIFHLTGNGMGGHA